MSKVITFSRVFPSYHPRKGEPTYFVEKVLKGLPHTGMEEPEGLEIDLGMMAEAWTKSHTIRAGHRWKVGEWFSPRVWSGRPYSSKQISIAPDIQIKKIWNFSLHAGRFHIDDRPVSGWPGVYPIDVARNDGLSIMDFKNWFQFPKSFEGQIICWNENINY